MDTLDRCLQNSTDLVICPFHRARFLAKALQVMGTRSDHSQAEVFFSLATASTAYMAKKWSSSYSIAEDHHIILSSDIHIQWRTILWHKPITDRATTTRTQQKPKRFGWHIDRRLIVRSIRLKIKARSAIHPYQHGLHEKPALIYWLQFLLLLLKPPKTTKKLVIDNIYSIQL